MILTILNLYVVPMLPIKFRLNLTYCLGGDLVLGISRWPPGGHFGYLNETILAIPNIYVTVMSPIKFWLNPINRLGGDID